MLEVRKLNKRFGDVQAVNDLSFTVRKGSTFAFLGTNGAGKSTVIHMLIDLLHPDSGEIIYDEGMRQEDVGVVFQNHRMDDSFTLEENLFIRAQLYGMNKKEAQKRVEELLQVMNLTAKRHRVYGECSGGEKRKTDILRALLHRPSFLILDEPTTGLDAESREEIWVFLKKLQADLGMTIFLTTHYIEEAENVDYVVIMHEGKVEVEGTPNQLRVDYSKTILTLISKDTEELLNLLTTHSYLFTSENNTFFIEIQNSKEAIPILQQTADLIIDFSITKASLEHVFLQVTKQIKNRVKS
ncbi:ABC transporter ATP-binding protein [Jeotgalibaca sp. MA1X17-3]|uniref:ABC transporter ATP-binding protein n=1 Tax=Jeotgalibaca sp. MA1X17-3 TaxID=2908211 RepID=UPI001F3697E2|nr:ABC transporter ATP-binding protein [Jeotgalibaca sp. MA1X17-3]UJF16048.1 ABC transporter ATP-binding protein [Jeotgalibaca sp. MA1X17-3]